MVRPRISVFARMVALALLAAFSLTAQAADTKLSIYLWDGAGQADRIEQFLNHDSTFAKENPGVEVEIMVRSGDIARNEQLVVWAAAGMAPDIVDVNDGVIISLLGTDVFRDLTPYLEKDGDFGESALIASAVAAMRHGGQLLGLPTGVQVMAMYQNATLFGEAGVAVLAPDEQWTWSDLEDLLMKLRRAEGGETVQWGHGIHTGTGRVPQWFWQAGADFWDQDLSRSLLSSPEAVDALAFMQGLVERDLIPREQSWGVNDMFLRGELGTLQEGTWTIGAFSNDAPFDLAVTSPPSHRERAARAAINGFAITAESKNPDAAWNLVKYLAGPEFFEQVEIWRTASIPALVGLQTRWQELLHENHPDLAGIDAFVYAVNDARTVYRPSGMDGVWDNVMSRLWNSEISPAAAAEELGTLLTALLR